MRYVDADDIMQEIRRIANTPKISDEAYSVCTELANKLYHIDYLSWINAKYVMPEEHDSIFAKYKGTHIWNKAMFEKSSNKVLVVVEHKGDRVTTIASTCDGEWYCDLLKASPGSKIIYWMPLPKPPKD